MNIGTRLKEVSYVVGISLGKKNNMNLVTS